MDKSCRDGLTIKQVGYRAGLGNGLGSVGLRCNRNNDVSHFDVSVLTVDETVDAVWDEQATRM